MSTVKAIEEKSINHKMEKSSEQSEEDEKNSRQRSNISKLNTD